MPEVEEIQNHAISQISKLENLKKMHSHKKRAHLNGILLESRLESVTACCRKIIHCYYTNQTSNFNANKALPLRYRNMGGQAEYELEDMFGGEVRGGLQMATREWIALVQLGIENKHILLRNIRLAAKRHGRLEPILDALVQGLISLDSMRHLAQQMQSPHWLYVQDNEHRSHSPYDIPDLSKYANALRGALLTRLRVRRKGKVHLVPLFTFVTRPTNVMDGFWSICTRHTGRELKSLRKNQFFGLGKSLSCLKGPFTEDLPSIERTRFALLEFLKSCEETGMESFPRKHEKDLQKPLRHAVKEMKETHIRDIIAILEIFARLPWSKEYVSQYASFCTDIYSRIRSIIDSKDGRSVKYQNMTSREVSGNPQSTGLEVVDEWQNAYLDDKEHEKQNPQLTPAESRKNDPYYIFPRRTFVRGDFTVRHVHPQEVLQLTNVLARVQRKVAVAGSIGRSHGIDNETTLIQDLITRHFPSHGSMDTRFGAAAASTDIRDICGALFSLLAANSVNGSRGNLFTETKESDVLQRFAFMFSASLGSTDRSCEQIVEISQLQHPGILILEGQSAQPIRATIHSVCGCLYAFTMLHFYFDGISSGLSSIISLAPSLGTYSMLLVLRTVKNLQGSAAIRDTQSIITLLCASIAKTLTCRGIEHGSEPSVDTKKPRANLKPEKSRLFATNASLRELAYLACAIGDVELCCSVLQLLHERTRSLMVDLKYPTKLRTKGNLPTKESQRFLEKLGVIVQYLALRSVVPSSQPTADAKGGSGKSGLHDKDVIVINCVGTLLQVTKSKDMAVYLSCPVVSNLMCSLSAILEATLRNSEYFIQNAGKGNTNKKCDHVEELLLALNKLVNFSVDTNVSNSLSAIYGQLDSLPFILRKILLHSTSPVFQVSKNSLKMYTDVLHSLTSYLGNIFHMISEDKHRSFLLDKLLFGKVKRVLVEIDSHSSKLCSVMLRKKIGCVLGIKLAYLEASLDASMKASPVEQNQEIKYEILELLSMATRMDCLQEVERWMTEAQEQAS